MRQKIGYFLLSSWLVSLTLLLIIVLSTSYSSGLVVYVLTLFVLVVTLLPVSAYMLNVRLLRVLSFIPLVLTIVYLFILRPHKINGDSMNPHIKSGEYVLDNRIAFLASNPKVGDVVIYNNGETSISRIVAVPGDKILVKGGYVYINDKILINYLASESEQYEHTLSDEYLLLGDKLSTTPMSLAYRVVARKDIKGRVFLKYWPKLERVERIYPKFVDDKEVFERTANTPPSTISKSKIECYRYNTPVIKKADGQGLVECSILASDRIDVTKSYCESSITKKRAYFQGFLQMNQFGYGATLDAVNLDETATLKIYDLDGQLVDCQNRLR